jgi:hypothetical protein
MASKTTGPVSVVLGELHADSGRISAAKIAEFLHIPLSQLAEGLSAKYPAVHKTPDASSLQVGLGPIKRSLELIASVTRDDNEARAWLNSPHPDLENATPLQMILRGKADAVVTLLENAINGFPS